ncbi:DUF6348 family protein [Singulisphaera rosea]
MSGIPDDIQPLEANPGYRGPIRLAFANSERQWEEQADLVALLVEVLGQNGESASSHKGRWVEHEASGYRLLPLIVSFQPLEEGGVQTVTTIQVHHPTVVPGGIFEFQHSTGDNTEVAIRRAFEQWVQTDFITLVDATRPKGEACMQLMLTLPETEDRPKRTRRATLGPIAHYQSTPPANDPEDEHPFCPCCLLTRSFLAFKPLLEGDEFFGVRLFALRDNHGVPEADCRVNGEDYPVGAEALKEYAEGWPAAGYEFRKQYVIIQTAEDESV